MERILKCGCEIGYRKYLGCEKHKECICVEYNSCLGDECECQCGGCYDE